MRGTTSKKEKIRLRLEEETLLRNCDGIIVHNRSMKKKLASMGIPSEKMEVLGIFDYLIPEAGYAKARKDLPVVIAGALRPHKAGYAYRLPADVPFNLYGVGYEAEPQENVRYLGSFEPDRLPEVMEGCFQLLRLCWGEAGFLAVHLIAIDALHEPRLALAEINPCNLRHVDKLGHFAHLLAECLGPQVGNVLVHGSKHPQLVFYKFLVEDSFLLGGHGSLKLKLVLFCCLYFLWGCGFFVCLSHQLMSRILNVIV